MGREVVKMVLGDPELELVAATYRGNERIDAGTLVGLNPSGVYLSNDLEQAFADHKPDVVVDFTVPQAAKQNIDVAIHYGVRPVVGATGFNEQEVAALDKLCRERGIGGLIAPNFSIGAILMMRFAAQAAKYFPHLEIIEYHGDQKLDAPSGTSIKTAELIAQNREEIRQGNPNEEEVLEGARGGLYNGFRIHSVRLPGIFAQQEVIMASYCQSLKIRHDSYERAAYMPGVNIGVKKVMTYTGLVYGFDHFID
jgi:4-hydroxy-tetrahydrodipicolinate reductase